MVPLVLTVARVRWRDGVVVLAVSGELDMCTADQFDKELAGLAAAGHRRIALDLAGLSFCDASGLQVLVMASARAKAARGWVRLAAAVPRVRRLVVITRLTGALPMFATVGHALGPLAASGSLEELNGPFPPGANDSR